MGADGIATSASGPNPTMQTASSAKIQIVGEQVIIAGTGAVGLSQRFHEIVKTCWTEKAFQSPCLQCAANIAGLTSRNFAASNTPFQQNYGFGFAALMAAPFAKEIELIEFAQSDLQPEKKAHPLHFVSIGSGQQVADPFLAFVNRMLWKSQLPTLADGKLGVLWALRHAIRHAPSGVGGDILMASLVTSGGQSRAKMISTDELAEFEQHLAVLGSELIKQLDFAPFG